MRSASLGRFVLAAVLCLWACATVWPYDVVADVHPDHAEAAAGAAAWLGTDHLGRDVFARLVHATSAFMAPGLAAAALATTLGGALGALGGWFGGVTERAVGWLFTVVAAIPRLVLVLLACTIFGSGAWILAVAVAVGCAPETGSAVLGQILRLRQAEFVTAARAHGLPDARVLMYHLLWVNCRHALARQACQVFGFFLVLETTLSYLGGFGVPEPTPSWGNMLAFEFGIQDGNPWASVAPALMVWATVWAANAVGGELGRAEGRRGG